MESDVLADRKITIIETELNRNALNDCNSSGEWGCGAGRRKCAIVKMHKIAYIYIYKFGLVSFPTMPEIRVYTVYDHL